MARTQDSWSSIPAELAGLVLGRLHAHADRVRFAAVCPQWRSTARQVPLPPPPPLLALKEGDIFYSMPGGERLHFAGYRKGHLAGWKPGFDTACGNWLVYHRFSDLLLLDPFSGATMTLPAPSSVNLADETEDDDDDDSMDSHDSGDEVEDSEDGYDSADEGDDDSEDGSAPSRVHLPNGNRVDDSRASNDSANEAKDSEDGHNSADKGDDSEDGSAPSSIHLPNENIGDDSRDDRDSVDEGEDSEDDRDSADESDDASNGQDSADEREDSEGGHSSTDEGEDSEDGSVYTDQSEMELRDVKYFEVIRLMVCSPNLVAALFKGSETNRIARRPGGSKWSVAWGLSLWITDMAFYQGKLYVVDYHEDLFALDISMDDKTGDPRASQIRWVINVNQFDNDLTVLRMLYLVESCGSLLLVRRSIFHTHVHGDGQIYTFAGQCEPDLSIFEADFVRSQWVKVMTLVDNQALFLGPCSRAICMPQNDSPGNRVWFLDDYKDFLLWSDYRDTSSVANPKPFSPLQMISWKGYLGNAGAAWIFPAN